MKTFRFVLQMDTTITVPDEFITSLREVAADEESTTEFLKEMVALHGDDDEAFVKAVLKNGLRGNMRQSLIAMCTQSKLGIRLAPASIGVEDVQIPGIPPEPEVELADPEPAD